MNQSNLKPYKPGELRAVENGQKGRTTKSRKPKRTKEVERSCKDVVRYGDKTKRKGKVIE